MYIKSVGEMMTTDAKRKKTRLVRQTETLRLSVAGSKALVAALENQPKANKKLLKAGLHYKDTVNTLKHLTPHRLR